MSVINFQWGGYLLKGLESGPRGKVKRKWKKYRLDYQLDVYKKEFGVQVDHKWYTATIGYVYGYQTISERNIIVDRLVYTLPPDGNRFYDSSLEEKLGGLNQKLG